jgi:CarD family transcriptional regulator
MKTSGASAVSTRRAPTSGAKKPLPQRISAKAVSSSSASKKTSSRPSSPKENTSPPNQRTSSGKPTKHLAEARIPSGQPPAPAAQTSQGKATAGKAAPVKPAIAAASSSPTKSTPPTKAPTELASRAAEPRPIETPKPPPAPPVMKPAPSGPAAPESILTAAPELREEPAPVRPLPVPEPSLLPASAGPAVVATAEVQQADDPKVMQPSQAPEQPTAATPPAVAAERRAPQPDRHPMPAPRPLAKQENFAEGDHVVYPTHGVGKVERIATEDIAGHRLELIHITFEENRMTLRVPVAKARTAGLRKLATRKLFDEALAVLKGRARVKRTMWSRRAQEYEAKINSGDPLAIAEVVRDLHRNAGQPDQSFSERQIYEAAMDRLAAELAALDQTDKTTAATKLADFLKTV